MLKALLVDICRLDKKLREIFLEQLIKIEDKIGYRIKSEELFEIAIGKPFHGINIWKRFYIESQEYLEEQKEKINKVNDILLSGEPIKWETLVGFFGYMIGFHEYIVHDATFENIFDKGKSGNHFIQDIVKLKGLSSQKSKIRWRAASALNHFCISYYVMINSNKEMRKHYKNYKNMNFYFNQGMDISIVRKHIKNLVKKFEKMYKIGIRDIDYIFLETKLIAENINYDKPIMSTMAEVDLDKKIKRFRFRIAQGPITPPLLNDKLYEPDSIIQYHKGTEFARRNF